MPHTVTLAYRPPLRQYASRVPTWRQLLSIADAAVERLMTLWQGFFQDIRTRVHADVLTEALETNIFEARSYIAQVWEQAVEVPARRLVPVIGQEVVEDAGEVQAVALRRLLGQDVPYTRGLPETEQWVQQYVGTDVRDITQTSLLAVQHVLRAGMQARMAPRTVAREVRQVLGLTARDQRTLANMRMRFVAQGRPAAAIRRLTAQATQQMLQRRVKLIAETESLRMAHRGSWEAVAQAVQRGAVAVEQVRRTWRLAPGACTPICVPIPRMNPPQGVGLHELFETPVGPLLYPPGHPRCRCVVITRVQGRL